MPLNLPGSWPEMQTEVERYRREEQPGRELLSLYEDVYAVWYRYFDRIGYPEAVMKDTEEVLRERFRRGRYMLEGRSLPVDPVLFREVLAELAGAVSPRCPEGANPRAILKREELHPGRAGAFLARVAAWSSTQLQDYLRERGWEAGAGMSAEVLGFLILNALTPFYIRYAETVAPVAPVALWTEGYCPVCGQKPLMARLRREDGARFLECRLCHTQWQFPRLECPFCRNRDFAQQQHFYADEYPGRRVQLCECCKSYLKTAVEKEIGYTVLLELENLITLQLDSLARREGYRPGEDLALLT